MEIEATVQREWKDKSYTSKAGDLVVPLTLTVMELGPRPMLQLLDYVLQPEEASLFGTLAGKRVTIGVDQIRSIFSGRPRLGGRLMKAEGSMMGPEGFLQAAKNGGNGSK